MAKFTLSALLTTLTGRMGGTTFQNSVGGYQMRTTPTVRNPRTYVQQHSRAKFSYLAGQWPLLSPLQRQTWIDHAPTGTPGNSFYRSCNMNLFSAGTAPIASFAPTAAPATMEINIGPIDQTELFILATGAVTTVPAGTVLVISMTLAASPGISFFTRSRYTQVCTIAAGTNLSGLTDLLALIPPTRRVLKDGLKYSIESHLVLLSNGLSSAPFYSTAIAERPNRTGFSVVAGVANSTICAAPRMDSYELPVFTGGTVATWDKAQQIPVTGYNFIRQEGGVVWTIDPVTGVIGAVSGPSC